MTLADEGVLVEQTFAIPVKAGIYGDQKLMDSRFRWNDAVQGFIETATSRLFL
jgi:hypothetical protein